MLDIRTIGRWITIVLLIFISRHTYGSEPKNVNWPGFRGPDASGVTDSYPTPTEWNVEEYDKVKWKTPIPGLAHSSPVIWGDRIFVTTAINIEQEPTLKVGLYGDIAPATDDVTHKWVVFCIDKNSGEILWQRTAHEGVPKIKRHPKSTHANPTPATNGDYVIAFFGSEGLYCFDVRGNLIWEKALGILDSGYYVAQYAQWGFGSSPVIHKDMVIVQCDVQKNSFIAAFNLKNGTEIWRTARNDVPTWSTPTAHAGQIIVNGYRHIGGYDLETGKEVWKLKGGGDIPVPTPVVAHDLVFITNAHGGVSPIYAIRLNATGNISLQEGSTSNAHVAWSKRRGGAYMQTPLVYGEYFFSCTDNGVLSCFKAKSGERIYRKRIGYGGTGFTASPVAADGKLYITSENGEIHVIEIGPDFKVLATNEMGEVCMATPAISEGMLFFRTQKHLVAIGDN